MLWSRSGVEEIRERTPEMVTRRRVAGPPPFPRGHHPTSPRSLHVCHPAHRRRHRRHLRTRHRPGHRAPLRPRGVGRGRARPRRRALREDRRRDRQRIRRARLRPRHRRDLRGVRRRRPVRGRCGGRQGKDPRLRPRLARLPPGALSRSGREGFGLPRIGRAGNLQHRHSRGDLTARPVPPAAARLRPQPGATHRSTHRSVAAGLRRRPIGLPDRAGLVSAGPRTGRLRFRDRHRRPGRRGHPPRRRGPWRTSPASPHRSRSWRPPSNSGTP